MKATFKNIGPIKEAELELGDLTIIAGQNNTGKTYLAYTLYGFLESLSKKEFYMERLLNSIDSKFSKEVKNIASQVEETGKARIDISEYENIKRWVMQRASSMFSTKLINKVFSSPNGEFQDAYVNLATKHENRLLKVVAHSNDSREKRVYLTSGVHEHGLVFALTNHQNLPFSNEQVRGVSVLLINTILGNFPEPFILSAERFGISLFYKELDFTKNRLVEELQNLPDDKGFDPFRFLEKQSARYAKPIKDNIDFTRDLFRVQKLKGEMPIDKYRSIENIMTGYYRVKNDEIRFISKRRGDNHFDIPLHLASSSARGVSDLYFYLKHVAEPGEVLIVDEPESHLSPTNQVMMARLLVFCVNAGLKILITTHSDYLIKEINNLIMLNSNFKGKDAFLNKHKKDYTEADHLNPESVKAYACEDGTLKPCDVDEKGIDMPVFDGAIDKINQISNELGWQIMPDE